MSQIQVTTLESNAVSANVITAGQTTVNSTGLYLGKTETDYSGVVRRNSLVVGANDLDYTLSHDFNNSSDSYTASGATITNFATYLRLTSSSADPILQTPSLNYYGTQIGKIVIKIKRIAGSGWDGSVFYATSGHSYSESYKMLMTQPTWVGTEWAYIQLDAINQLTGGNDFITNFVTQIRFDFGSTISDIFEIDYIRFYPIGVLTDIVSAPSITIGGTNYTSIINEAVNTQIFDVAGSNTWTKPAWAAGAGGNALVVVHMWGGGGGGADLGAGAAANNFAGGGGAFVFGYYKASQLGSTASVYVGGGGTNGNPGAFSGFNSNTLLAYGGGGGNTTSAVGGGGGGWLSTGGTNTAGGPLGGNSTSVTSTFGGGFNGNNSVPAPGDSVYGGGGGAGSTASAGTKGGNSVFGGGGGATGVTAEGGTSIFGGKGGGTSNAPRTPGGGGRGGYGPVGDRHGARGEVRIYTYRIIA